MSPPLARDTLIEAGEGLLARRQRSALALIGIVIGTASVVGTIIIGYNAKAEAAEVFRGLGIDTMVAQVTSASRPLAWDLTITLPHRLPAIDRVEPAMSGQTDVASDHAHRGATVIAAEPGFGPLAGAEIASGRGLLPIDGQIYSAVIGSDIRSGCLHEQPHDSRPTTRHNGRHMAHRLERLTIRRRWATVLVCALVGVAVILVLRSHSKAASITEGTAVAQVQPLELAVTVAGTIGASDKVEVPAPFDSVVRTLPVRLGQNVASGQVLMTFDTTELAQHAREAEAAELKAAQAYRSITNWTMGLEAARARRSREAVTMAAADNRQRLRETEALFRDGIVARSELETQRQQARSDADAVANADDEWRALALQSSPDNRRVAEIEYHNAVERLQMARRQLASATLVAPRAGTLVRPQAKQEHPSDLAVGASVTRGQPLFAIADRRRLGISAKVDESDASRIREGQQIEVTGPAFSAPLTGRIVSISGEAAPDSAPGTASFIVTGELDPVSAEAGRLIRLGMTANIRVVVAARPSVLVVPPAAIQGTAPGTTVTVIGKDGRSSPRPVAVGLVSDQGVEIRSGLKEGETVVVPSPTAAASQ